MKGWIAGTLLVALAAVAIGTGTIAQEEPPDPTPEPATETTANVEVRVWQAVRDARSIYISARPEDGSWATLGTIPLPLDDGHSSSGRFRYGDITVAVPVGSGEKDVEVRVWQAVRDARSIYVSARPEGGSWATLGTIPLPLDDGHSSSGRFRYGDITVEVPVPLPSAPTATPTPTPTPTPEVDRSLWPRHLIQRAASPRTPDQRDGLYSSVGLGGYQPSTCTAWGWLPGRLADGSIGEHGFKYLPEGPFGPACYPADWLPGERPVYTSTPTPTPDPREAAWARCFPSAYTWRDLNDEWRAAQVRTSDLKRRERATLRIAAKACFDYNIVIRYDRAPYQFERDTCADATLASDTQLDYAVRGNKLRNDPGLGWHTAGCLFDHMMFRTQH